MHSVCWKSHDDSQWGQEQSAQHTPGTAVDEAVDRASLMDSSPEGGVRQHANNKRFFSAATYETRKHVSNIVHP